MGDDSGSSRVGETANQALGRALAPVADEFQKAGPKVGKNLGEIATTVTGAARLMLAPLKAVVWGYDRFEQWIDEEVQPRLDSIPEDRRIEPRLMIAGPALNALKFVVEEPELRELFAKLLVAAMDSATAQKAHPAFVEVIRQLSPNEARFLTALRPRGPIPTLELRLQLKSIQGFALIGRNYSVVGEPLGIGIEETSAILDNLCRLGIGRVPPRDKLIKVEVYEPLENHPFVQQWRDSMNKSTDAALSIERQYFEPTAFGNLFLECCVVEVATS